MFELHFYVRDEEFDLLKGTLPLSLAFHFGDQLRRAQAIIQHRSKEEIEYGMESLEWMLKKGDELFFHEVINSDDKIVSVSRVKAMKSFQQNIDLDNQENFPNATWAEYFAILTLIYIAEALQSENWQAPKENKTQFEEQLAKQTEVTVGGLLAEWAIQTMDAVCYAEQLDSESKLSGKTSKKVAQEKGKKGGEIRAEKYNDLNNTVINLYESKYSNQSNRNAAKLILKDLPESDLAVLTCDDPQKRFEIWIGKHKKHKAP